MANMEVFDSYFRRADLDRDGRISGAEAVAFFQGSNLPKQILAQIWMHADQNRTGFLGRAEFYNALKLVTVAQSGRELTPDIVKAALYGPAAAKIPAPQINPMPSPASQSNPMAPSPQKSMGPPSVPQSYSVRGMQTPPNAGMNQQSFPSPDNKFMRPQATSAALPMQGVVTQGLPGIVNAVGPRFTNPNISNDLSSVRPAGASMTDTSTAPIQGISPSVTPDGFGLGASIGATAGLPNRAANPTSQEGFGLGSGLTPRPSRPQAPSFSLSSVSDKPQDASLSSLQPAARDLKTSSASGNGFSPDSFFGGDVFSVSASQLRQDVPASSVSATTTANSSAIVPVAAGPQYSSGSVPAAAGSQYSSAIVPSAAGPQSSIKQSQVDPFQALTMTGGSSQLQQTSSLGIQSQVNSVQRASALAAYGVSVGTNASASSESQTPWPRMTQSDIQKYMKVFTAVDADRDGRITGEEARNLFLSWRLPREVLKQVWDLSDQDNDSMLSLREFCTALYLMERYREGHSLPGVLPDSIKFDKTLLAITGPPVPPAYGSAAWQPSPGFSQAGVSGVQAVMPGSGLRPTAQGTLFRMDGAAQPMPQKSGIPVMEKNIGNQIIKEQQKALNSNLQEATEADKKNEESQKEILDSKEKIALYRTMMQELVLYKSRCDNRLNEITERASADKREAELLAKKYEEKYKQVGETASKLTIEEATFRDMQERKMELHNAILNMEQGGSADGLLQVRADRIQSDLEELGKALNDRCKRHGLNVKSTTMIEIPFGWQPGIQEGAAHWDEDWDKFEDEGFMVAKDLADVDHNMASTRTKPSLVQRDEIMEDGFGVTSSLYDDSKMDTPSSTVARAAESSSAFDHSEDDLVRSPSGSPTPSRRSEDSSRDFTAAHFGKNVGADSSPRAKETQSDHGGAESNISGDKYDESSWGATFDGNDDVDSVWGFNSVKTKDHEQEQGSFFGSSDFGLNPIRTESPNAEGTFLKKNSVFADSIPNTPLFNSNSPARYSEGSEDHTDHFTRFDSFRTHDSGFFPQESLTRFDSIPSTRDSDHNRGHDSLARFDSIRSTRDSEHGRGFSFDDSDPFGLNAPFKSSESQTSRKGSDSWSAF